MTKEWKEKLTPLRSEDPIFQKCLDWWHNLPIQNLLNVNDSWVGYIGKYFPNYEHPYHLTVSQIAYIYRKEMQEYLNILKLKSNI
jgi:hypothetical protein